MTSLYKTPVTNLNGIGEKRAALFARLGIKSVGDLINFYPRTYEDWSNIKHIDELEYGETVCIKAVVATSVNDTRISGGRIISKTAVYDETGSIQLVFLTINTSAQCSDRAENISFTEKSHQTATECRLYLRLLLLLSREHKSARFTDKRQDFRVNRLNQPYDRHFQCCRQKLRILCPMP